MKRNNEKQISENLGSQKIDSDKVQGGLKVANPEFVEKVNPFSDIKRPDETVQGAKSKLRKAAKASFKSKGKS